MNPRACAGRPGRRVLRGIEAALLGAALLAIGVITLNPALSSPDAVLERTPVYCIICGDQGLVDFSLNVVLFVPLGFLLARRGLSARAVAVTCLALTATIELLQFGVVPGRDASLGDILANGSGAILGVVAAVHGWRLLNPGPAVAGRLAAAGAGAWLLHLLVVGHALLPAPTAPADYDGYVARVFPATVPFRGTITSATLDGIPVPDAPFADPQAVRESFGELPVRLSIEARGGLPTRWIALLVGVRSDYLRLTEVLQRRCTLLFWVRLRAEDLKLAYPGIRLRAPCRDDPTRPFQVVGELRRDELSLTLRDDSGTWRQALPLTPTLGWSLLVPLEGAYADPVAATTAWVLAPFLLLGYWARRSRRRWAPGALAVVIAAGLWAVPAALGLAFPRLVEWMAAGGGAAVGALLEPVIARRWTARGTR